MSIGKRLWAWVALVAVGAIALGAVAVSSAGGLARLGEDSHLLGSIADDATVLALAFERYDGLVQRAPAELDLDKLAQQKKVAVAAAKRVGDSLQTLIGRLESASPDLASLVRLRQAKESFARYNQGAADVYQKAENFLQGEAVEILNGPFAAAAAGIRSALTQAGKETSDLAAQKVVRMDEAVTSLSQGMTGGVMVFLAALIVAAVVLIRSICKPLAAMTTTIRLLGEGDLSVEVPGTGRSDEFGEIGQAVCVLRDYGLESRRLEAEQQHLKQQAEQEKRETLNKLADQLGSCVRNIMAGVSSASKQVGSTARELAVNALQANQQCSVVEKSAAHAASNVQSVSSAAEVLASSISEINREVSESAKMAGMAVEQANETNATVASLVEAAQKIGEVVKLIKTIASQTNLLALNATIEAARAGEAGKGFAVVANEDKNLANQTAKATEEISGQIGEIQSVTAKAVDAIKNISETIRHMNEVAAAISESINHQGAATSDIMQNVREAAESTEEVSSAIHCVVSAANETRTGAEQTLIAANSVSQAADSLTHEVERFIATIRGG